MSDSNDKKPASSNPGWPSANDPTRQGSAVGHAIDDPLAELDRIVNQNYGSGSTGGQQHGVVSDEDLRFLEQELIRELRGKQAAEPQAPAAPQAEPASTQAASSYTRPEQSAPSREGLDRPHPLSPSATARQASPAPQRSGPSLGSADYAAERPAAPEVGSASRYEPPQMATESSAPAAPRAAMPSSDSASKSNVSAPSLDDWSNLFADDAPDTSYGEPAAPAAPAPSTRSTEPYYSAPQRTEPRYAEPSQSRSAPSLDAGTAVSGSYGQLSRSSSRQAETAPSDRMSSYRPSQSDNGRNEVAAAAAAPRVASTWDEQVAELQGSGYQETPRREAPRSAQSSQSYADPAQRSAYSSAYDQASSQSVPEVSAPVASDPASDPYAAFNQQVAQPGYNDPQAYADAQSYAETQSYADPHAYGTAPNVDVSGHNQDYAADPRYYDPQMYADPNAAQAHDPNYAAYDQAYQGEYAQGTYADPAVAQAAMEGMPYATDEEYSAADVEAAAAASASAAQKKKKSRKGLVPLLAAVGVVIVGGLVAWGFFAGDNGSTETPVITAETDPVKEAPEDPGGKVVPHQNKTVYNRIDGTETDEAPSSMMPATETPLALDSNGQSPRVIDMSSDKSAETNDGTSIAPKEVRTVIVRPDGTIVPQEAQTEAAENEVAALDNPLLQATPSETAIQQTLDTNVNGTSNQTDLTTAVETAPLPRAKPDELVALQAAQTSQNDNVLTVPQPTATPVTPQPVQTNPGPLVLQPTNTPVQAPVATQVPVNNASNGEYTVQVTSQRTPEQARASYASIQAQLPTVLGGYQPDIKEADLGDRGTYYRVRVGSFADRASATNFCSSIKAAGGDCLVARR
ncbi:SPOR domain-containing protein [uncultured Cohaesibacter sp.]|uniref:SPOR domain-containing protein n=1 Tax=uncultured Cohaesibacter sp. TaxID=1002546 RepID=UPI0029C6EAD7|nr:SPOR domain-containing protein [uncultured Cohaesibacter sp.]